MVNADGTVSAPSYVTSTGTYNNVGAAVTAANAQTNALGTSIASGLGGTSSYNPATGSVTTSLNVAGNPYSDVNSALNAVNASATAGWNVTTAAVGTGVVTGTSVANVAPGATHTITAGDNIVVTQTGTNVALAVNPNLNVTSVTTGNTVMTTGGVTVSGGPNGAVALTGTGLNNGNNTITNVAAGVNATDAVNVAQLTTATQAGTNANTLAVRYDWTDANGNGIAEAGEVNYGNVTLAGATGTTLSNVAAGAVNATSTQAVNGSQLYATNQQVTQNSSNLAALGASTATALGGTSSYDPATGQVTAGLTVGGNSYADVNSAINAINATASAGWNIAANGSAPTNIPSNGTLNVTQGANTAVTLAGNQLQVAVVQNPTFSGMVTANGGLTVGAGQTVNMGNNVVTGVAAGAVNATSTDAVNGSQLYAASFSAQNAVQYDAGRSGVTLNPGGNAIQMHNVAAGTAPTDAVNVSQLNVSMADAVAQANNYTDTRIMALNYDLRGFNRDANAGTAGALAAAGMPQAFEPGKGMIAGGLGYYDGEGAIAIGASRIMDDGRVIMKAGATYNTRGKAGANVGVGYQF